MFEETALDGTPAQAATVRAALERRAVELARVAESVSTAEASEFVVFGVGGESYAVPASGVSAVFKLAELAVVPGAPAFVRGLALFKGQVLPVLDLRVLIGAPLAALSDLASVVALGGERGEVGLLADSIEGIRRLAQHEIHPAPARSEDSRSAYATGMTHDAVLLLDADALVRFFHGGGS